jgi:hypothetical protein
MAWDAGYVAGMTAGPETFDRMATFRLAADKIERDPELLERSRETLVRWLEQGVTPRKRLQGWIDRIDRARRDPRDFEDLLRRLREEGEDAEFDREFSPFACLLSKAERRALIEKCAYSH